MIAPSRLLINEPPLQCLPSLAVAIGLNEAIFLQQLHYRLLNSKHLHDQRVWYYNTAEEWAEEFPFWSVPTIRRIVNKLRGFGVVLVSDEYNEISADRTFWYSIDYEVLEEKWVITPCDQVDHSMLSDRSLTSSVASDQVDHTITNRKEVPTKSKAATPVAGGVSDFVKAYQDIWGMMVASPYIADQIKDWEARVTLDAWKYALEEAMKNNKRTWKYLEGILNRVEVDGITSSKDSSTPGKDSTDSVTDFYLKDLL